MLVEGEKLLPSWATSDRGESLIIADEDVRLFRAVQWMQAVEHEHRPGDGSAYWLDDRSGVVQRFDSALSQRCAVQANAGKVRRWCPCTPVASSIRLCPSNQFPARDRPLGLAAEVEHPARPRRLSPILRFH